MSLAFESGTGIIWLRADWAIRAALLMAWTFIFGFGGDGYRKGPIAYAVTGVIISGAVVWSFLGKQSVSVAGGTLTIRTFFCGLPLWTRTHDLSQISYSKVERYGFRGFTFKVVFFDRAGNRQTLGAAFSLGPQDAERLREEISKRLL